MPLEPRDAALLLDMLDSCRVALRYGAGRRRQDLDDDMMLADAIIGRVEVIGEAARGVSESARQELADIPWRAITATRHILAHDYDAVNHDIVWRILTEHLPPLEHRRSELLSAWPEAPPP